MDTHADTVESLFYDYAVLVPYSGKVREIPDTPPKAERIIILFF
jgi:hypothetical protein